MTMKMTIAYVYCSHCLHYSKAAIEANFFSCSSCGKLVSEVNVKGNPDSVVKKKSKFPRFKRTKKNSMKIKDTIPITVHQILLGNDRHQSVHPLLLFISIQLILFCSYIMLECLF
ncbi:hypothetical protein V6Z11_A08G013600 [Gossypium hirsutum]|uniref:Uncharacterized protein n=2 Tax=Gossypium TaxID=3633 RepID=A0A5D2PA30_GOSTO|nr:hypothetical protein ES288_A08G012800v1 [Gossypium darwinii]TYI12776.1 hypothetical protein ES332_A08G012000v1 [Gossypium tomentosum]